MSVVALTTFIVFYDARGRVQYRFQNSQVGTRISYGSASYPYLSFIYQGAAKNRTGDNLEAALMMSLNQVSQPYAVQAVQEKWTVEVFSVSMNPTTFTPARTLSKETWIASSLTYDTETIEVLLSSAIDAVGSSAPTRVLVESMVGKLPVSGSIQNR